MCATPRVGSNFLCHLLLATGRVGNTKEFLCPTQVQSLGGEHCGYANLEEGERHLNDYFATMREVFSKEGVFGAKAHFKQFGWALEHGFDLQRHFPDRFVHITRADLIGQAISYLRASQTQEWIHDHESRGEPHFDAEALHQAVVELVRSSQGWESLFQTLGIQPYRLSYESLCADVPGELGSLLRFLDIDPGTVDLEATVEDAGRRYKIQRDELSERWRAGYAEYLRLKAEDQARVMKPDVPAGRPAVPASPR